MVFYPSIFDSRSRPAGEGILSTVMMAHFVAHVRGAKDSARGRSSLSRIVLWLRGGRGLLLAASAR